MNITVPIPDDLAQQLNADGNIDRRALEAFAADEYRAGRLTLLELRRLLGFGPHVALEAFLRARGIDRRDGASNPGDPEHVNLAEAVRRRFASVGGVDDLVVAPRQATRPPPQFDR